MTRFTAISLVALLAPMVSPWAIAAPAQRQQPAEAATVREFQAFVAALKPDARALGISDATFVAAFKDVTAPDPAVISRTRAQGEFSRPVWDYLVGAVSSGRIDRGKAEAARLDATLSRIEASYGVPRAVLVAIWGVESDFGASGGTTSVIRSQATLSQVRYRGTLFRDELLAALTILEQGDVSAGTMKGSWAGAMGQVQFLPSNYLKHAVDYDGDKRRDIWTSRPDALASIAAFLRSLGWNASLSWGYAVTLPPGFDLTRYRGDLSDFAGRGVRRIDGKALPASGNASLFLPGGASGPVFLITDNFEVIRGYNTSDSYALAIGHLADRLAGGPPLAVPWPSAVSRLDRAGLQALQKGLAAAGFYQGETDGRAGPKLREAVRRYQIGAGLVADGYATPELLAHVQTYR